MILTVLVVLAGLNAVLVVVLAVDCWSRHAAERRLRRIIDQLKNTPGEPDDPADWWKKR